MFSYKKQLQIDVTMFKYTSSKVSVSPCYLNLFTRRWRSRDRCGAARAADVNHQHQSVSRVYWQWASVQCPMCARSCIWVYAAVGYPSYEISFSFRLIDLWSHDVPPTTQCKTRWWVVMLLAVWMVQYETGLYKNQQTRMLSRKVALACLIITILAVFVPNVFHRHSGKY